MSRSHDSTPRGPKVDRTHGPKSAAPKTDIASTGRPLLPEGPSRGLAPHDLLRLQRIAGNKAARIAVQRHKLSESREGIGEEDDEIERPVQTYVDRGQPHVQRWGSGLRTGRRAPSFGRHGAPPARPRLWGTAGAAPVQRKNGGGAAVKDPAHAKGVPDAKDAAADAKAAELKTALKEYGEFVGGGPYKINDFVPDFTENFGKFDTVYDPGDKKLTINMRVKFTFPDLPVPKVVNPMDIINVVKVKAIRAAYVTNFLTQVHTGWSGKFQFKNVREPEAVWNKLNPISVKLNVTASDTNPHYVMKAFLKKAGTANVSPNPKKGAGTVTLFKGDLDPSTQSFTGSKQTGPDEITRLQRNLPKIRFANNSTDIEPKYVPDLRYVSDYLKRMNTPRFEIDIIGRANKTGPEPPNVAMSVKRAQAVQDRMKAFGVTNHGLTHKGVGSAGATADGSWRKVDFDIKVDKSFSNIQDTTLHEFGHMLGLDDEYVTTRAIQLQHQRNFVRKMLGTEDYGKGNENKYADEVSKKDPLESASVMYSGNEVRVYHYVTMWQALFNTAAKAAKQPATPFTFKDWKVIG